MLPDELCRRFEHLTTAHLADACLRAAVPARCAPALLSRQSDKVKIRESMLSQDERAKEVLIE